MGSILSRFKRKKNTKQVLESLENINNQRSLLNTPNRPQIVPNRTHQRVTPNVGQIPAIMSSTIKPRLSLPRPVLPKERTIFDRLADIILGDGPQNRYALICRTCGSHNGMARKEEFEYLAYRCAYCSQWNPSLKPRPALSQFAISYDKKDLTNNSQSDNSETIEEITSEENSKSEQKGFKNEDSNLDSSEPIVEEPEDSQQIDVSINNLDDEKKEKFEPIEKSTALVEAS
ncbi:endoplasmic reticulum junction formation protein lunapark isoform X5 [Daktulosphaira vitifoliae]|uniref:endoplasmic reticulum junction formation protein lunapark isoform X5 n=1 Tax=Daktulosphaira vitifoliae TaxID=58002 RepID=UPI0021A9BB17|nr:endoplasmic reticulum junction formation protein lunapark isoform X5 [Daktulosphaira vitifoliae]